MLRKTVVALMATAAVAMLVPDVASAGSGPSNGEWNVKIAASSKTSQVEQAAGECRASHPYLRLRNNVG